MLLPQRMSMISDGARLSVIRQRNERPDASVPIIPIPCADAFAVIVQLADFRRHKLWRGNRLVYAGGHARQGVAITDLTEDWRCQHLSPFDNVRLLIPRPALDEFTFNSGGTPIKRFECPRDTRDPVIYHLAQALVPLMTTGNDPDPFVLDHISLALLSHITGTYGADRREWRGDKGRLAPWQEQRAKDFMLEHLAGSVSLEQIARECRLSRAHFARYFKNATGMPAYTWLQKMRVRKALELLRHADYSLTQIALECGFTDQSHFSRVFKQFTMTSPGQWRRRQKA
ncbi:AraC family transcriptional regulator [Martelella alba]|nr:AraC family transcriptional regulator [Martelella alba]